MTHLTHHEAHSHNADHYYKAAVIIPSRGGAHLLHYPLEALRAQTEKDFQVIVVLDGDIDNSEAVLKKYAAEGGLNLSTIIFPENRGRVAALNAGHRAANAKVLIRCDDDLQPDEHYVANHLKYHTADDGEQGVIGIYLNQFPTTPYSKVYGEYRDRLFREAAYAADESTRWNYWAGNVSMSKKLFDDIGGYDPAYRLYGWEDVDMGYEIYRRGATIHIAPELATKHYVAATTTSVRALRALHSGAARSIFVRKHGEQAHTAPNPGGVWGVAVKTLALFTTERTIKTVGDASDRILLKLPVKLAEKIVALQVEAASYAGVKYPRRAQKVF